MDIAKKCWLAFILITCTWPRSLSQTTLPVHVRFKNEEVLLMFLLQKFIAMKKQKKVHKQELLLSETTKQELKRKSKMFLDGEW